MTTFETLHTEKSKDRIVTVKFNNRISYILNCRIIFKSFTLLFTFYIHLGYFAYLFVSSIIDDGPWSMALIAHVVHPRDKKKDSHFFAPTHITHITHPQHAFEFSYAKRPHTYVYVEIYRDPKNRDLLMCVQLVSNLRIRCSSSVFITSFVEYRSALTRFMG